MTIQAHVTLTGKGYAPTAEWRVLGDETHTFPSMEEARAWLRTRYGKAKRAPMFRDRKDGTSVRCGYVIGYRDSDVSHFPVEHWLAQDWVEFRTSEPIDLDAKPVEP